MPANREDREAWMRKVQEGLRMKTYKRSKGGHIIPTNSNQPFGVKRKRVGRDNPRAVYMRAWRENKKRLSDMKSKSTLDPQAVYVHYVKNLGSFPGNVIRWKQCD
jgi:hypothetical protein